ncbi:hypothetical protein [Cupriavidus sp. AcVe19-6a]|uniref:hypothetical protein n=1 Tax=Cupriavidus sp. AcVe19-6a TaxID=2821358 RepID=UPI001AE35925|nr:hypothetical protein [Cupriavidus sp. AcVe19-6a]MBP0639723.1 hypothetical protein [Cupriavidus sp. AcVe19-6a]
MQTETFLEEADRYFNAGDCISAMRTINSGLASVRSAMHDEEWKDFVVTAREHPALKTTRLCPFTSHAARRPYGYPGDAALIDYIYGYVKPELDKLPRSIYAHTVGAAAPRAVRFRRHLLANLIDRVLHEQGTGASILAVACGHLRELDLSRLISQIRPQRFLALDQDENSLAEVDKCFAPFGVSTELRRIKDIVVGKVSYKPLDLAYAAGLYDYLDNETAQMLTRNLFNMLGPGGTLHIANFLPGIEDVGFMEVAMDWWLIYRDEKQMLALLEGIPDTAIGSVRQYRDPDNNITFLEVQRQ